MLNININGKKVYNLTGTEIRLWNGIEYVSIPSDGIVEVYYRDERSRWAEAAVLDNGTRVWALTPRSFEDRYVDNVDDWFYEWDGDFIVPFEYYFACRELGLPTDRLYTVGEAFHDGKVVEGYRALIKH